MKLKCWTLVCPVSGLPVLPVSPAPPDKEPLFVVSRLSAPETDGGLPVPVWPGLVLKRSFGSCKVEL